MSTFVNQTERAEKHMKNLLSKFYLSPVIQPSNCTEL